MLASTVQFSTTNQPPPTPPPPDTHPPTAQAGTTTTETHARGNAPEPPRSTLSPAPEGTSSPSRTSSDHRSPAELVSVPPSSTTPHTRRPPKMRTDPGAGAALDRQTTSAGQLLLRKEVIQPHLPVR